MNSFLHILKLNEVREGVKEGRPWKMQDAECIIYTETGEVDQVGVLSIGRSLEGKVQPGMYVGSFALRASTRRDGQRRIEAVLTGLTPVQKTAKGFVAVTGAAS